jgi:DNA-binding CsgD family transcriptional regulator
MIWLMPQERNHQLTEREREILLWSCRGKTFADTAMILGISTASIKTYLDHARWKLNAVNITQAAAIAVAVGIFTAEDILNRPEARSSPDQALGSEVALDEGQRPKA